MKRELVISSDDLGMTLSVNRGIQAALRQKALSSANFMVPCPWFEHAVARFRNASLDLGVHLTLTCEWDHYKWRPLTRGNSLLNTSGDMHRTIPELMQSAREEEIRAECRQQIALALTRQLPIAYADVHMCLPTIENDGQTGEARLVNPDYELALMRIVNGVVEDLGLQYPYALEGGRLKHFGSALSISGKSRSTVEAYIRSLGPGVHHLSCHCAVASAEQDNLTSTTNDAHPWALSYRVADLECITSAWFRDLLRAEGVDLVRMPFVRRGESRE
jgi:chitin disaccharide deacetylase